MANHNHKQTVSLNPSPKPNPNHNRKQTVSLNPSPKLKRAQHWQTILPEYCHFNDLALLANIIDNYMTIYCFFVVKTHTMQNSAVIANICCKSKGIWTVRNEYERTQNTRKSDSVVLHNYTVSGYRNVRWRLSKCGTDVMWIAAYGAESATQFGLKIHYN